MENLFVTCPETGRLEEIGCIVDRDGALRSIPYHRVKQVFRNGELIWQREH